MSKVPFMSVVLLLICGDLSAQPVFTDDFDDGNFAGWSIWHQAEGTIDASSGALQITSPPAPTQAMHKLALDRSGDVPNVPEFANGIYSAEVTVDTIHTSAGIGFRTDPKYGTGYFAELLVGPNGGQLAVLNRVDVLFQPIPLLSIDDVWSLGETYRLDVTFVGPDLDFMVTELSSGQTWNDSARDRTYREGFIELVAGNSPFLGTVSAQFDNISFTSIPIPEPSSLFLCSVALISFLGLSRMRPRSLARMTCAWMREAEMRQTHAIY